MPTVEYMTVTGLWSHIIDDGIVDGDPNPDVVHPTGKVVFAPKLPAGFVVGGSPAENVTIAELPALIAGGILTDLQGNTGVKLPKSVDGTPIRWVAKPDVRYGKQTLPSKSVTFDPPTTGDTLHLNDVFDDIGDVSPLVTSQVKTYRDEARDARDAAQQILDDVEAGAVPDSAIASKITTTGTNTRAAVDARADARIGAANLLSKTVADATYAPASLADDVDARGVLPEFHTTPTVVVQSEVPPTPQRFGAKGNDVDDDTGAVVALLSAGYKEVLFPPGTYGVTSTISQPKYTSIQGNQATIKAKASMPALLTAGNTDGTNGPAGQWLRNVNLDANNLATVGVAANYIANWYVDDVLVLSPVTDGIVLGHPDTPYSAFGANFTNVNIQRRSGDAMPVGSRGMWVRRCSDNDMKKIYPVDFDIGFQTDSGDSRYEQVHPWGHEGLLPTTCFLDNSDRNIYIGCVADTPSAYGWYLTGYFAQFYACTVYVNTFGPDNTVVGMYATQASPNLKVVHPIFRGHSASRRLAKDFGANALRGATVLAPTYTNVVQVQCDRTRFYDKAEFYSVVNVTSDNADALTVRNTANTAIMHVNGSSREVSLPNGSPLVGYSDAYTSKTWQIDPRGVFRPAALGSADRTALSGVAAGDTVWDSDLKKLVTHDGTQWRNTLTTDMASCPLVSGTYFATLGGPPATVTMTDQKLLGGLLQAGRDATLVEIGAEVVTAGSSGALLRLGIYQVTDWSAGTAALVLDAGTVDAASTGYKSLTISQAVQRGGDYILAYVSQGAATTQPVVRATQGGAGLPCFGSATALTASGTAINGTQAFSISGALPATLTLSASASGARVLVKA